MADYDFEADHDVDDDTSSTLSTSETSATTTTSASVISRELRSIDAEILTTAEYVSTFNNTTSIAVIQSEVEDLATLYNRHTLSYNKLIAKSTCEEPEVSLRQEFVRRYKEIKAILLRLLPVSSTVVESAPKRVKCEKLVLPVFNGNTDDWPTFKSIYEAMIHKDEFLQTIDKHQLLRSKLTGEAASLIEGVPLAGEYYDAVWKILVSHYEDPHSRLVKHLDAIQSCPRIQKSSSLNSLIVNFRANVSAIKVTLEQNPQVSGVDQILIHAFLSKADKNTRLDWEHELMRRNTTMVTFEEFIGYMQSKSKAQLRVAAGMITNGSTNDRKGIIGAVMEKPGRSACYYCNQEGHLLYRCEKFRALQQNDRFTFIKKHRLCLRCISKKCSGNCLKVCTKCRKNHHELIHRDKADVTSGKNYNRCFKAYPTLEISEMAPFGLIGSLVTDTTYALLATAKVLVSVPGKKGIVIRVLLDSGSQFNVISEEFVKKLKAPFQRKCYSIYGISNISTKALGITSLQLQANQKNNQFMVKTEFIVLDEISPYVPCIPFEINGWCLPHSSQLADPNFNAPGSVDAILGVTLFWKILSSQRRVLGDGLPILYNTKLGWIVTGSLNLNQCAKASPKYIMCLQGDKLMNVIEKLWLLDDTHSRLWTAEEIECEAFFLKTTIRIETGRFRVRLPFNAMSNKLGLSYPQALKRFLYLEKRLERDEKLCNDYKKGIYDFVNLGHMRCVSLDPEIGYYIPHHAVIKETSTSTKCRVVFDASMPTSSGVSLNDCLLKGPVVQSDLFSILMRFRTYKYVFMADIVKMYRQIQVNDEDAQYQRILWRDSPTDELIAYEISVVAFGTKTAPYLATRCLTHLAELDGEKYPLARDPLIHDFYVDDVLTGSNSIDTLKAMREQLTEILASAGFELSKFGSNSEEVLRGLDDNKCQTNFSLQMDENVNVKTLGILWSPQTDQFQIWVHIDPPNIPTKREVLSIISSIFDPLGFVGPVIVVAKLLMQALWSESSNNNSTKRLNWTDEIPLHLQPTWHKLIKQLPMLNEFRIPRCLLEPNYELIELHGFADASERAYGAVIYCRAIYSNYVKTSLLCSKSRVAPLKRQTLPRLELCAALLLAELGRKVLITLKKNYQFSCLRMWSDSEIVLAWINSPSSRWTTFVANRVQRIQLESEGFTWDHIDSKSNPADLLSRGMSPVELKESTLWWKGPEQLWMSPNPTPLTTKLHQLKKCELELKKQNVILTIVQTSNIFTKVSTYWKLVRLVAWSLRFKNNATLRLRTNSNNLKSYVIGPLKVDELKKAFICLVKLAQYESFAIEVHALQVGAEVPKTSRLKALDPFIDVKGILRVGGRLEHAEISYSQRHPIILCSRHIFTKLFIRCEHDKHFHAGPRLLKATLRRQFWILRQNTAIRQCIKNCVRCVRAKGEALSQKMGNLPPTRVNPVAPFTFVGVDYAGPFRIIEKGGRKKQEGNAYIAVFVCFTTKALHLELVTNLTTVAFFGAFDRFVSRRGIPQKIMSDNGRTFVGAASALQALKGFLNTSSEQLTDYWSSKWCNWYFIPPSAPHFGGLWEAGVKSIKHHLYKTTKDASLTFEQFSTLIAQIEACLNSRPLIGDCENCDILTPSHFLIGRPLTALPSEDVVNANPNRLKYWNQVKFYMQNFWKRWSDEYLHTLQQRTKWQFQKEQVKPGSIVVIKDELRPPLYWPLGMVLKVHHSKDKLVRLVTVRIGRKEFKRPINKLVLLPTEENND